jgi:hypothetical protein
MIHLPIRIYHLPQSITLPIGPKARIDTQSIGIPTFPKSMSFIMLKVASVDRSIAITHDAESMSEVGGGMTFTLVRWVSIVDNDNGIWPWRR